MKLKFEKEKALKYFIYFLLFMLFCTLVSRAIYSTRLPKIREEAIEARTIGHNITATGTVESSGRQAVWTISDLRVAAVYVKEGENIEAGAPLFKIDTDSLADAIAALQNEIAQLDASMNTAAENERLTQSEQETAIKRAKEDKQTALAAADAAIVEAQNEVNAAQSELDAYAQTSTQTDTADWESTYQNLAAVLAEKQQALSNAMLARSAAETEADRQIEDAGRDTAADASTIIDELTKEERQQKLEDYLVLQETEGLVSSETAGSIEKVNLSVGELTSALAAVIIETAEDTVEFVTNITKEEKKYVEIGDDVELKFSDETIYEEGKVKRILENDKEEGEAESYQLSIEIPATVAAIGMSGEMKITKTSELYQSTVPLEALYSDGSGYFVYVVNTTDTILGKEVSVEKRRVTLADKNNSFAALDDTSGLSDGDMVVTYSNKEINAGDKVRLLEE